MSLFGSPNVEKLKAKRDVKGLIAVLSRKDVSLRKAAVEALMEIGDKCAVEPLVNVLMDNDKYVRYAAAKALDSLDWQPGSDENGARYWIAYLGFKTNIEWLSVAVAPLIVVLKDSDKYVRQDAVKALRQTGDTRAVEPLIATLGDEFEYVRSDAAEALGDLKDARAVEPLITALKDKEWGVRYRSADALGQIGDARAVGPLITALKDKSYEMSSVVHEHIAEALGKLENAQAVEPLIAALKDEHEKVRVSAAKALGQIGDTRAVDPLIAALKDREKVREAATEALGELKDSRAVEPLLTFLEDENAGVRKRAAEVLDKLGWKPDNTSVQSVYYWIAKGESDRCAEIGASAIEPLMHFVTNEKKQDRSNALMALGKIVAQTADVSLRKQAVEVFISILQNEHEDSSLRSCAASQLSRTGDERIPDLMVGVLRSRNQGGYFLRRSALVILVDSGDPRAVEELISYRRETGHDGDKEWVYRAMVKTGDARVIVPILNAFFDPNAWSYKPPKEAGEALAALLLDDRDDLRFATERIVDQVFNQMFSRGMAAAGYYMKTLDEYKTKLEPRKEMNKELLCASKSGDIEKVKNLIERGAEIETTDKNGDTPLIHSADNGHLEVVKFLIEKGASANQGNQTGWTPLCYAAIRGRHEVVNFLLDHGADVNAHCQSYSVLMWVIRQQNNSIEMIKLLVKRGADINAKSENDITTLQIAYNNEEHEIAKFLEGLGAGK